MSDYKIVQCFGIKKRPRRPDQPCRKKFLWTARGLGKNHFGRKGTQACPNCGTLPDFAHPYNQYLDGALTFEEATSRMSDWEQEKKNRTLT